MKDWCGLYYRACESGNGKRNWMFMGASHVRTLNPAEYTLHGMKPIGYLFLCCSFR